MRVLIEREGADGGQVVVEKNQVCRIGRNAPAEIALAEDSFVSGMHCAIQYADSTWKVCDLESSNGTFLNGTRIRQAALKDGDRIQAGQTFFHIRIEQETLAPAALPAFDDSQLKEPQRDALEVLAKMAAPFFALLDAARDGRVLDLLRSSSERYQSLYEGQQGRELDAWAPYLVELSQESTLLRWLLHEGWGRSWGVYLVCTKPFAEVRKHFRHFLAVEGPNGKQLFFRFYDPRVLRRFLAGATTEEADAFFGPVDCYVLEGEDPSALLRIDRFTRGMLASGLAGA